MKVVPRISVVLAWLFVAAGGKVSSSRAQAADLHPRVAMMDFTTDDHLMRSASGAAQWSVLTQDALARQEPSVIWLERAQLHLAADELHLSVGGYTSTDHSLRVGKWLHADLAILGRFMRNEKNDAGHTLRLEVIDLNRADTLAARTIHLDGDRRDAVLVDPALIPATAAALRDALAEARLKLARTQKQTVLAPLFFCNTDPSPRLNGFGADLMAALARSATLPPEVRVLNFPEADRARDEADLVVRGLAESDPDAWQRVADLYVWGSYRELPGSETAFVQTPVELELTLWDGVSPPLRLREKTVVSQLPALARRLADRCVDTARRVPAVRPPVSPAVRAEIARSLREQGQRIETAIASYGAQRVAFLQTPEGKTLARQQRLLSEVACFFAPGDRDAQLTRLRAVWEDFPSPVQRLPMLDLWRRCHDLKGFAERFGSVGDDPRFPDLAAICVDAEAFLVRQLQYGEDQVHGPRSAPNLPVDATDANIAAWHIALDAEFVHDVRAYADGVANQPARNATAADQSYPIWLSAAVQYMPDRAAAAGIVEKLWPLYKDSYQKKPERSDQLYDARNGGGDLVSTVRTLFTSLHQPERAEALFGSRHPGSAAPAGTPGAAMASAGAPAAGLPRLTPAIRTLRLPWLPEPAGELVIDHGESLYVVHSLAVAADDLLWISASCFEGVRRYGGVPEPRQEVWSFDPADDAFQVAPAIGLPAQTPITSILPQADRLWLTVDFTGVMQYDPGQLRVTRRYTAADGLVTANMDTSSTADGKRLYFAGHENGLPLLNRLDPDRQEWTRVDVPASATRTPPTVPAAQVVAFAHWLLVGLGDTWKLVDTENHRSQDLREALPAALRTSLAESARAAARTELFPGGLPFRCPRPCAADAHGFWLALDGQILRLDPAHPEAASLVPLPAELTNGVTALVVDGDNVWVAGPLISSGKAPGSPAPEYLGRMARLAPRFGFGPKMEARGLVAVLNGADGQWRGGVEVPALVCCLAVSRHSVYVGLEATAQPLLEIDKHAALHGDAR